MIARSAARTTSGKAVLVYGLVEKLLENLLDVILPWSLEVQRRKINVKHRSSSSPGFPPRVDGR